MSLEMRPVSQADVWIGESQPPHPQQLFSVTFPRTRGITPSSCSYQTQPWNADWVAEYDWDQREAVSQDLISLLCLRIDLVGPGYSVFGLVCLGLWIR